MTPTATTDVTTSAATPAPVRIFAQILGLELEQAPRALRLLAFIFAVSVGLVVMKAAQSGLLLAAYDDTRAVLPRAFALSAVFLSIASAASASATVKIGPSALAVRGLVISAATLVWLRALLALHVFPRAMPLFTYAAIEATSGVLLIQCWSLVSEAVDPRTAKQILPAAGIGASLAWTIGGAAVPALVRAIGPSALLLVTPIAFVGAAAIGRVVTLRDLPRGRAPKSKAGVIEAWKSGLSFVLGAPLMRLMMVLSVLALASEQLFDFMLMASAKETLGTQKAISSFFGGYYCVTSLLSLVVLTSLSSRLLARLRASESLALTPVLTTLAALAMLVRPGLPAATLLRGADRVLKQSIWGSAAEQTQTPLPAARRAQARALVRGVIAPLGYAMVSAVLGALPSGFDLRWLAIGAIAVTTVMSTLILTSMRKRYVLALRSSIDRRKLRLADAGDATGVGDGATADATLDADAIAALREELETQDPSRATLAAELLGTARTIPAALALIEATEHASTDVRTHATDGLGDVPLGDASTDEAIAILDALCDRLQRDPVVAVRRAAARGLRVQLGRLRRGGSAALRDRARKGLRAGRSDTHRDVRAICTVAETEDDVRSGASTRHALVELLHAPDFETREAALTAVSARLGRDREIRAAVREALADENHDVRMQALRTVTRARIDALLPAIAPLLVDARDAPAAIAELSSWGDDALSVASRALPSLPASRLLDWKGDAPLSRVGALASESRPISRLLEHDSAAAALSMRHSPAIPRAVLEPLLDRELTATERLVSCLVGVARDASVERPPFPAPFASLGHELTLRLDDGRARILRLLALAESRRLADLVRVGLREASGARRAHALELLESTLERALARRVVPLFERTDLVALREVLELRGRLDADAVAHPLKALRDLGDVDDPLRTIAWMAYSSARDASAAIEPTAPTEPVLDGERAMIPLYERMLFLRRVALLADLGIEDLRRVAEIVEPIELTAGNKVFCRGEPGEDLYLVSSGAIALRDEAGAELARHHEGETFGELSVLDQEPRTEDAICVEGATVLRLRGADFAELMAQRPRIQEQVMRVLVRKLRALERR